MVSTSSNFLQETPSILLKRVSSIGRDSQFEVSNGLREEAVRLRKQPELLLMLVIFCISPHSSIFKLRYMARP